MSRPNSWSALPTSIRATSTTGSLVAVWLLYSIVVFPHHPFDFCGQSSIIQTCVLFIRIEPLCEHLPYSRPRWLCTGDEGCPAPSAPGHWSHGGPRLSSGAHSSGLGRPQRSCSGMSCSDETLWTKAATASAEPPQHSPDPPGCHNGTETRLWFVGISPGLLVGMYLQNVLTSYSGSTADVFSKPNWITCTGTGFCPPRFFGNTGWIGRNAGFTTFHVTEDPDGVLDAALVWINPVLTWTEEGVLVICWTKRFQHTKEKAKEPHRSSFEGSTA